MSGAARKKPVVAAPAVVHAPYDRRRPRTGSKPPGPPDLDPLTLPIEPGITLVEASAGTGKTFAITQLVVRLLLDKGDQGEYRVGDVGRILVVTFTNAATDELITRVRATLRRAVDVFAGDETERTPETEFLFALRDQYGAREVTRLREALGQLDRLSIFTIHGFCKHVLDESALESGAPFGATFLDDDGELLRQATEDWWRRTMYEDARLATLAVGLAWTPDKFVGDFRLWNRRPGARLAPDVPLPVALEALDAALAKVRAAWDEERVMSLLGRLNWLSEAPLASAEARAAVPRMAASLGTDDWGHALDLFRTCGTSALLHDKKGVKKRPPEDREAVADEPFFLACDEMAECVRALGQSVRCDFLRQIAASFEAEKRRRHAMGFDDLLRRLCDALTSQGADGQLAHAVRRRWDAALIDEFQDTDSFQFPIFTTAFGGRPLFLIGDPKQAIYGFRGADVFAYMRAVALADRRYTLRKNWRSTPAMVAAVGALFGRVDDAFLYDEALIPFVPGDAARRESGPLGGDDAALHWWFLPPETNAKGVPACRAKGSAEKLFRRRTAQEIVRLLAEDGLQPRDIAVLVRSNREAESVQEVLREAGVPSIIAGTGDVVKSREMDELARVLAAVIAPQDVRALRSALATELWGLDAAAIHALAQPEGEPEWQRLVEQLTASRECWRRHGFMRMAQELFAALGVHERLLRYADGERRLTNLRHCAELLHAASAEERLSAEALLLWIARARADDAPASERTELRLESDADAVQVVTIHKSKGLEYGVVFCTGLWEGRAVKDEKPILVHQADGTFVFDHGSPEREANGRLAQAEQLAEDLRMAYVAVTRAKWRCYLGWGAVEGRDRGTSAVRSALGYLLRPDPSPVEGTAEDRAERVAAHLEQSIAEWQGALEELVASSGGAMRCHVLGDDVGELPVWTAPERMVRAPQARVLTPVRGQLESWTVSSYTHFTRGAHSDVRDLADAPAAGSTDPEAAPASGFAAFPSGRQAGIALHEILERVDFTAAGGEEARGVVTEVLRRERLAGPRDDRVPDVLAMLAAVTSAPLPDAGFGLRDVTRDVCLREWTFHLPLDRLTGRSLMAAFERHGGEVARAYAPRLRALNHAEARGFLTGVVDLAFTHGGRWFVVDWKSNNLGASPAAYEREPLERAMFDAHYTLQYHLYVLALHRFLRCRLPGYDYERHMGGAYYAFLRGFDGESSSGWYHDRPSLALIEALDAIAGAGVAS